MNDNKSQDDTDFDDWCNLALWGTLTNVTIFWFCGQSGKKCCSVTNSEKQC